MQLTNRRKLMATAMIACSSMTLKRAAFAQDDSAATPGAGTGEQPQASMPDWGFVVRNYVDPYQGKLTFPDGVGADKHVIQVEVVIINASDQPLSFKASDVHLLDNEGVEYAAGNAQGSEPKLVSQDLPDGERTRGSVWYIVPDSAVITEVKFYAPPPQLRVRIGNSE
jgi:hypothetical protein